MKLFAPNLDARGRWIRAVGAAVMLVGAAAGFALGLSLWLGGLLLAAGLFVGFEALRGWCVLRACGIKTRI